MIETKGTKTFTIIADFNDPNDAIAFVKQFEGCAKWFKVNDWGGFTVMIGLEKRCLK